MQSALDGIRVIELGSFLAAPRTAKRLADMGAEVIKIEPPITGDPLRGFSGITRLSESSASFPYMFELENQNKKSIVVDLSKEQGREIVRKMVTRADVFVTNLLTCDLQKLGVGYDTLARLNPKIVYALISCWGLKGPEKDRRGFDISAFARSGIMGTVGEPEEPPPTLLHGMGDHITAANLAYGIMLALFHRERTGEGQLVHVSVLASLLDATAIALQACLSARQDVPKVSRRSAGNPLWNSYQTGDHKWLVLLMPQTELYWHDVCQALNLGALEHDPRFNSHELRCRNCHALISILDKALATKSRTEWQKIFEGRNIIWEPIKTFAEVAADPQLWENGYLGKFDHPVAGPIDIVGPCIQLGKTPDQIRNAAPEFGQHTEEVLLELGYSWDDVTRMKEQKIVN